jgi:Tol biopolymer transport system component
MKAIIIRLMGGLMVMFGGFTLLALATRLLVPANGVLAFVGVESDLTRAHFIMDVERGFVTNYRPVIRDQYDQVGNSVVTFSPDGTHHARTRWLAGTGDIMVKNLVDGAIENLTADFANNVYAPAWSPDGSQITFAAARDEGFRNSDVYMMNADGSALIQLTHHPDISFTDPAWSPDGRRIATQAWRWTHGIFIIEPGSDALHKITGDLENIDHFSWSPDGTKIAFVTARLGKSEIYVVNVDGGIPDNLAATPDYDRHFSWSPDSQHIVFISDQTGNPELHRIHIHTRETRRLTFTRDRQESQPQWQPYEQFRALPVDS